MRTIRFRVWSTLREPEMIYLPEDGDYRGSDLNESADWKVMQFTGLTDKNGKEIYEGDIVKDCSRHWDDHNTKLHDRTGFVKYLGYIDMAEFQAANDTDGISVKNECSNGWFPLSNKIEVIGNIYENKELLK